MIKLLLKLLPDKHNLVQQPRINNNFYNKKILKKEKGKDHLLMKNMNFLTNNNNSSKFLKK